MKDDKPKVAHPMLPKSMIDFAKNYSKGVINHDPAEVDRLMKIASVTLVDPGVPISGYVNGERIDAAGLVLTGNVRTKISSTARFYVDADVGFLLKNMALQKRTTPRLLLEKIIKEAALADERVKSGSIS